MYVILAAVTVDFPLSTYTTIMLSLAMAGFGFFIGGYYAGHSQFSSETSQGVRRIWTSVFTLIAFGATAFALRKIFYANLAPNTYGDGFEVALIAVAGGTLGLALALACLIGLHERFPTVAAWSLSTIPGLAYVASEILVIIEALRPAGASRGPDYALTYFGIFEVCAVAFLLVVIYGPRALGVKRESSALLMMMGLILFLVATLIYGLGPQTTESNQLMVDRAGWFIGFHLAGIFFIFLAALPTPAHDAEIEQIISTAEAQTPIPAPRPVLVPARSSYSEPVTMYRDSNGIPATATIVQSDNVMGRERR